MTEIQKGLLQAAYHYARLGLSPIPVDAHKQSCVKWAVFQQRIATATEINEMFSLPAVAGIALVCGKVSGGLEVIDVDDKNDLDGRLFERLLADIYSYSPALAGALVAAGTRSQGHHLYYRCAEPGNNCKLAGRPTNQTERLTNPDQLIKVLVETRGQKGYVIVPPTPGYRYLQHELKDIPLIGDTEREAIISIGRRYDRIPAKKKLQRTPSLRSRSSDDPLTDYDQRGDVISILLSHGWTIAAAQRERTFLKRPGDSQSRSSGNFHHTLRRFKVFSTSTHFEAEAPYSPSAVFAIMECQGDFKEAARRLLKMGYGKARLPKYQPDTRQQQRKRG